MSTSMLVKIETIEGSYVFDVTWRRENYYSFSFCDSIVSFWICLFDLSHVWIRSGFFRRFAVQIGNWIVATETLCPTDRNYENLFTFCRNSSLACAGTTTIMFGVDGQVETRGRRERRRRRWSETFINFPIFDPFTRVCRRSQSVSDVCPRIQI